MNSHRAPNVDAAVKDVAAYGGSLAAVFHQYALIADRIPSGFEGATNILDATVSTLTQVASLFKDEAQGLKNGLGKELFSNEGVIYVQRLVTECAKTLAKVEPIVNDACLPRKEFQAKVKRDKKELAKKGEPEVNISESKLDEKAFLEKVENTNWRLAQDPIGDCMERLYDLQLHLLLVYQVVTVGALSKDISTGKVDIKSIVTYHDRIVRTADLVGIEVPKGHKAPTKKPRDDTSTGSDSFSSDSDSDSDASSILPAKTKKKPLRMVGPPPPPPRPVVFIEPQKRPPPRTPTPPTSVNSSSVPPPPGRPGVPWDAKPPSYAESHKPVPNGSPTSTAASTLLGTVSQAPSSTAPTSPSTDEKSKLPTASSFPDEKKPVETVKTEATKDTQIIKPTVHEPHLFRSKSNTFKFKIKSLFSSKEALAAEMRRALCGADSHLLAFVIQRHDMRQVPHSAFHSLEATHMKTILSQLNDNSWYQNFTSLNQTEHSALHRVLYPWADGKIHEREMVVLQVLKEESKLNAWVALLKELLNKNPFPPMSNGRIILAIVREKLVNGKSIVAPHRINMPPPPPPPPFIPAPVAPAIRPPPLPCTPRRTIISDLRKPPPSVPSYPTGPGGPPPRPGPFRGGPPPPPAANSPIYPPGNAPPGQTSNSIRISDTTPLTDHDAALSLTTYNEYTVRLSDPIGPHVPRSWARVAITQESAERHLVQQRVNQFQRNGGNVIEAKLRLSEDQSGQVTRLMDDLKFSERDTRFEWCWVEITLYNAAGEITDFIPKGPGNVATTATLMHLIAKRMPKPHVKPLDLYNSLMRGPPAPCPTPPGPPGPPTFRPQPPPPVRTPPKKKYVSDSSDSDSNTDSSWSGSDSSVGYVRRKMRKIKARKLGRVGKGKRFYNDSDEDSEIESEVEDVIKVKVEMKRGDDLVKKLLDLWTPSEDVKGKGKAVE